MKITYVITAILVAAAITMGLRALPFIIFSGQKNLPSALVYLSRVLPAAIMAVLVVYCLKDIGDNFWTHGIFECLAVGVTALSYKWKHHTLLSLFLGTSCYMLCCHFV